MWHEQASIFVMTSGYEVYRMHSLKRWPNSLPVVSYDCPSGLAEVVQHGVNGCLVEINNVQEMVRELCALMNDRLYAQKLSSSAKKI